MMNSLRKHNETQVEISLTRHSRSVSDLQLLALIWQLLNVSMTRPTRPSWYQWRVKETVKTHFSNLIPPVPDTGTRYNSKRVDSLGAGGRGELCPLMNFVKRIAFWAHWGEALRYPWRVQFSRAVQVSSGKKLKSLTHSGFRLRLENLSRVWVLSRKKNVYLTVPWVQITGGTSWSSITMLHPETLDPNETA